MLIFGWITSLPCLGCRCNSTREQPQRQPHRGSAQRQLNDQPVCEQRGRVHVGDFTSLWSALHIFTSANISSSIFVFCSRAWKLTLLETRRNPVSGSWSTRDQLGRLSSCGHLALLTLRGRLLCEGWDIVSLRTLLSSRAVGFHIWPLRRLLPGHPDQRLPHRLHQAWSRTRYVYVKTHVQH